MKYPKKKRASEINFSREEYIRGKIEQRIFRFQCKVGTLSSRLENRDTDIA